MNKKIPLGCAVVLATIAIFSTAPQNASQTDKSTEAARLNNLGAAYMNQQLFEKALKAFEQAAALDPKFQIATMNQGIALLNLGRVDAARKFLEQAVKESPRDAHAWYNLGMLEKNSANSAAAADAFRHATEIDPNDADTWYFLGRVICSEQTISRSNRRFPTRAEAEPTSRLRRIRTLPRLSAIGRSRSRSRTSCPLPIHHAKQIGLADQSGLWRARKVFARGRIACGSGKSSAADSCAVCGCNQGRGLARICRHW